MGMWTWVKEKAWEPRISITFGIIAHDILDVNMCDVRCNYDATCALCVVYTPHSTCSHPWYKVYHTHTHTHNIPHPLPYPLPFMANCHPFRGLPPPLEALQRIPKRWKRPWKPRSRRGLGVQGFLVDDAGRRWLARCDFGPWNFSVFDDLLFETSKTVRWVGYALMKMVMGNNGKYELAKPTRHSIQQSHSCGSIKSLWQVFFAF